MKLKKILEEEEIKRENELMDSFIKELGKLSQRLKAATEYENELAEKKLKENKN